MADQLKVTGRARTSFSEAAQNAAKEIKELRDDEQATFNMTHASVTVGGMSGITEYQVTLERAT